ncbi:ATP-binding protein [Streptomyces sp. NPDC050485]|uniref:ATP-binding protein n=1 Tax=Streptomyces sp. NPDC050485 TaxID=3365617 RepID=UPI0037AE8DFD
MLRRRIAAFLGVVAALLSVLVLTTPANADGGGTDVGHCDNDFVCGGVQVPGTPGTSDKPGKPGKPGGGGGGGGSSEKTCATGATHWGVWPCHIDGVGTFVESQGCYVSLADPQPPKSDPVWQGQSTGAIYFFVCLGETNGELPNGHNGGGARWQPTNPLNTGPTAAELAQQAFDRMRLDAAQIGSAPPADAKGLVGLPVWLWTAQSPQTWGPQSMTVSAGGLSVTVTATVRNIAWSMGDGSTVTCTKPGTPYQKSFGNADSPDCGHRYTKVGEYTVTATSTWAVNWTATNGETGTIPDATRNSSTTARVGELQVVN